MANPGKIVSLPREILEELHLRLWNNQNRQEILVWLNSLPTVRTILGRHFQSHPISEQNLSDYKLHGPYRDWAVRWDACQLAYKLHDKAALGHDIVSKLTTQDLFEWLRLQYFALAENLPSPEDNPHAHLLAIRQLCADIARISRDEIQREKLRLELERLALQKLQLQEQTEQAHEAWARRPDVRAKLYRGLAPDTMALIDRDRGVTPTPPPPPPPNNPAQDNPKPAP